MGEGRGEGGGREEGRKKMESDGGKEKGEKVK